MAMDESISRWIDNAHEADSIVARVTFEESVDAPTVGRIFGAAKGVNVVSWEPDGKSALVSFTPDGLESILHDQRLGEMFVEPPPGTGDPEDPGEPIPD